MKQIEADRENLKRQLDTEKAGREEEHQRRAKAVATAILFEIDNIFRYLVRDVQEFFEHNRGALDFAGRLLDKRIEKMPFTVYESNAGVPGTLEGPLVQGVVSLYGGFAAYLTTLNYLSAATDRARAASLGDSRRAEVEMFAKQAMDTVPHLLKLAEEVCARLCEFTGVPRELIAALVN